MIPNTAAPNAAQHAKSVLSIFMPTAGRTFCKVEENSDRNQESLQGFGNQPENPATEYNSAKENVPHMYITCQVIISSCAKNIHSRKKAVPIPCHISKPLSKNDRRISSSNGESQRFRCPFQISNFKSDISIRAFRFPHPGGFTCVTQSQLAPF
jgi:hypothetical protein